MTIARLDGTGGPAAPWSLPRFGSGSLLGIVLTVWVPAVAVSQSSTARDSAGVAIVTSTAPKVVTGWSFDPAPKLDLGAGSQLEFNSPVFVDLVLGVFLDEDDVPHVRGHPLRRPRQPEKP